MRWNLKSKVHGNKGPWKESFALCLWLIWRWRNDVIFNGKEISMNRKVAWIASYIQEIMSAFSNQAIACRGKFKSKMNWIGWRHPPPGWVKLNVVESTLKESGIVRARGTIRDAIERWIIRFTAQLEDRSIEVAETWALLHGLKMA